MYFSRIKMNLQNSNFSKWVKLIKSDLYNVHQTLWKLFPNQEKRPFLFYQDFQQVQTGEFSLRNQMPVFYIVSEVAPQLYSDLFIIDTKIYAPALHNGQYFDFKLRANPVIRVRKPHDKSSFTHDVLMHAKKKLKNKSEPIWPEMEKAALDWLLVRSGKYGFKLNADHIHVHEYQCHRLNKKNQNQFITFSSVEYSGILSVENVEIFKKTLFKGIGKAKSFGCGLLLIRPLSR